MKTFSVAFPFALVLFAVELAHAQPGDQRTPKQIRQQLNAKLDELSESIKKYPESVWSYIERAETYAALCWRTQNPDAKANYVDQAFKDFEKAIALQPTNYVIFVKRARVRQSIEWLTNFAGTEEDYFEAIRLAEKFGNDNPRREDYESPVPGIFAALSGLYLNRAEAAVGSPELHSQYSPWSDYDVATTYAQKAVQNPRDLLKVVGVRLQKGDAAYKLGEYSIALEAYYGDEKYLGENYNLLCTDDSDPTSHCAYEKRDLMIMLSMRRTNLYLKLRQGGQALAELEKYFAKAYELPCPEPFLLRAEANRLLGYNERAKADEELARKLPPLDVGSCDD